jgi:hypothetical protein
MTSITPSALASVSTKETGAINHPYHDGHRIVVLSCCMTMSLKGDSIELPTKS